MKAFNIILAAALIAGPQAHAGSVERSVNDTMTKVQELVTAQKAELYAQWILYSAILASINSAQDINEYVGIDKTNKVIGVSAVVGAMVGIIGTEKLADGTVRLLTPDGSKLANFRQSMVELRSERGAARSELSAARNSKNAEAIANAEAKLATVESKITRQLTLKPGILYKGARLARGLARTSITIGAIAAFTVAAGDVLIIAFPFETEVVEAKLNVEIKRLDALLDIAESVK